jgi:hypothetical protein
MALGTMLVSKLGAVVTYVKARVDIKLDYDSKNFKPSDSVTVTGVVAIVMAYIRGYTDSVTASESHTSAIGKNITSVDSVTPGDAVAMGINVNIAGTVTADDALLTYWGGMFAGSMFNDHMYAEGAVEVRMDDVAIVIT